MRLTKKQVEVILATIKALRASHELELHIEQSIETADDDMANLEFLEQMLISFPNGGYFGLAPDSIQPILKTLISVSALGGATANTSNAMKANAFKAGLGVVH